MNVEFQLASRDEHGVLMTNLYQFYLYEFSRYDPQFQINAQGRLDDTELDDYWEDNKHGNIYLIFSDGAVVGFAIVILNLEDEQLGFVHELAEFFIMAPYQQLGIGESAAQMLFDHHRGNWELCVLHSNLNALEFWRRTLERYTDDNFTEIQRPQEDDYLMAFSNQ